MNKAKDELVVSYENKILAVRNYKSDKQEFTTEDFIELKILGIILDEIDAGESDITPAGKLFIEQYYGFSNLANLMVSQNILAEAVGDLSVDELALWLERLEPMETNKFIKGSGVVN